MVDLFAPTVKKLEDHIDQLLRKVPKTGHVILTGGFSESQIVVKLITTRVRSIIDMGVVSSGIKVLNHMNASASVLLGALMIECNAGSAIRSRISRYTFAISDLQKRNNFIKGGGDTTSPHYGTTRFDDVCYVTNLLLPVITKGQQLDPDAESVISTYSLGKSASTCPIRLYMTERADTPVFSTEKDVVKLGTVTVALPHRAVGQRVDVAFKFGGTKTEVTARAISDGGKKCTPAHVTLNISACDGGDGDNSK